MLKEQDIRQLHRHGISAEEARRQLAMLAAGSRELDLVRPCTVGDGVLELSEDDLPELHEAHAVAAAAGRLSKFVPASGAATRMFGELATLGAEGSDRAQLEKRAAAGEKAAADLLAFVDGVSRLAIREELNESLGGVLDRLVAGSEFKPLFDALFAAGGLATLPKALLRFHRSRDGSTCTAFEEHLNEALDYTRDVSGCARLHFTIGGGTRPRFEQIARDFTRRLPDPLRLEIEYSQQKASTETLALDATGAPCRQRSGELALRPGGHGALIENLQATGGDLVFVKNIDNVQPERLRAESSRWKRALAGYLVQLQDAVFGYVHELSHAKPSAGLVQSASDFAREVLGIDVAALGEPGSLQCRRALLLQRLNRPLRLCGVVANTGEPGGGPFWVRDADGMVRRQIVESAQVNFEDARQCDIWRASTHFNPVDLVCGLRDQQGRIFDLRRFVDPSAVIVSEKSNEGRTIRVLERPGLWNGAMAGWNTLFVEVPLLTFTPVKSVCDLLRPEHQPD